MKNQLGYPIRFVNYGDTCEHTLLNKIKWFFQISMNDDLDHMITLWFTSTVQITVTR